MGRLQLGKTFAPEENAKIVAFLKTLSDGYLPGPLDCDEEE